MRIIKPLISVVLPAYNAEKYISLAVNSILKQEMNKFELIIINDGSTDRTIKILEEFSRLDSRILVVNRENKGLVYSLNEGIKLAQTNIIARMDADDIAMPERFGEQMAYLDSHPDCVCVGSDIEIMDDQGRKLVVWKQYKSDADIQRGALQGHCTICHPSAMFRKSAFDLCGGYRQDMYLAEDLDLWLRLGEIGELANVDQMLLRYRMLPQSISGLAAKDGLQRAIMKRASDAACQRRGIERSLFEATKPWRSDGTAAEELLNNLKFGWWAFSSNEFRTASSYGWKAWRSAPTSRQAFMLFVKSCISRFSYRG